MTVSDLVGIKVLYLEDEPFLRSLLASDLSDNKVEVLAVDSVAKALDAVRTQKFSLLIFDVNLGDGPSGIDLARATRNLGITTPILFLTNLSEPWLMDSGHGGNVPNSSFINKKDLSNVTDLLGHIRAFIAAPRLRSTTNVGSSQLTNKQKVMVRALAMGKTPQEIATEMGLTDRAVTATLSRAAERLNLSPSAGRTKTQQLILWANANKLGK